MRPSLSLAAIVWLALLGIAGCNPSSGDPRITDDLRSSCAGSSDAQITVTLDSFQVLRNNNVRESDAINQISESCAGFCAKGATCFSAAADVIYGQ